MHGAEHRGRGRAGTQAFLQEHARGFTRMRGVGKLLLGHEGVLVQPVEQLLAVRADDGRLWIVHMAVDEAGQHQRVAAVRLHGVTGGSVATWLAGPKCVMRPSAMARMASDS